MTSLAALSAAALLAGLSAAPLGDAPAATGDVTWRAGQAVWHGETGTYALSGGVRVQRGGVVLRAQQATVDPATGEVWAQGDVLLLDATRVVTAEALHAVLDGPFEASEVQAFYKDGPLDPLVVSSAAEACRGRNRLTFRAARVEGDGGGRLRLGGLRFTACDCGEGRSPTWELRAPRAEVEGDRLTLHWPVLRVTPPLMNRAVPVLIVPWLSLPLRGRQTGLLFPELGREAATGFHVGLPLFVTLGRSADLTVTPEYFFGPSDPRARGGAVEGPAAKLELRWAPAERAAGQILFHLVDDLDRERLTSGERGGAGLRLSVEGEHAQDLGPHTRLALQLSLSQDPFMFRDFRGVGLPGDAYYSRSAALVSRRGERWVLEGGAAYLEPLDAGDHPRPGPVSWFGVQAPTLHRWPWAAATLLPGALGPLQLEGRLGLARFAPIVGHQGRLLPTDAGSNAALFEPIAGGAAPREAVSRLDARVQLSSPRLLGGAISVAPFVRGAALGYAFDAGGDPAAVAWGVAGAAASLELARRFGEVEHRIGPRLELVAGSAAWSGGGEGPSAALDAWDRVDVDQPAVVQKLSAAPDGAYLQLRAALRNRVELGGGGRLTLDLGQDADLRRGELAESFASLAASAGPFTADASARFLAFGGRPPRPPAWRPSWLDDFTRLHLGAALRDARGDALRASLDSTGAGAVGAERAGVDALFDLRPSGVAPEAWVRAGARLVLGPAAVSYEAKLTARRVPALQCGAGKTRDDVGAGRVVDQSGALEWDSPCHCFKMRVDAGRDFCGNVTYGLSVDLSRIFQGPLPAAGRATTIEP